MADYQAGADFQVTDEDLRNLASSLAEKAQIDVDAAERVLRVMHIDELNETLAAVRDVLANEKAVNALGLSAGAAQERVKVLSREHLTLENLRVGFKPHGMVGLTV